MTDVVCSGCPKGWCKGCVPVILTDKEIAEMETMPTDKELLDWMQARLDERRYTGQVIARWSTTGRGFRLHETCTWGGLRSIRVAITKMMIEEAKKTGDKNVPTS